MESQKEIVVKHIQDLQSIIDKEEVIEGVEEKPLEEIIREVAEEEGLSEEEVAQAVEKLMNMNIGVKNKKRHTKAKRDSVKVKKAKKQAKKSKKRNR